MHTSQSFFFKLALLIVTIYFYHFILLSRTLTLPGDHKASAKQNYWLHFKGFQPEWCILTIYHCRDIPFWLETHDFLPHFHMIRMKFDVNEAVQAEHAESY